MSDEVTGQWRELHNGELHDVYSSPNITRVIKCRLRRVWHVAGMGGDESCLQAFGGEYLGKRDDCGKPRRKWRVILKWMFKKLVGEEMDWFGLAADGDREVAGICKCDNEPSVSIKCWEFLDQFRNCC